MLNIRTALLGAGEEMSDELRTELLATGREALPALHEILLDSSLVTDDSPGEGWAPIHAAELLGELAAKESVGPLLSAYADADWMEIIKEETLLALQAIGAPVLEPALLALAAAPLEEQREDFCTALAGLGVRDERILAALLALLPRSPGTAATCLATYGDERALPVLLAELDRHEVKVGGFLVDRTLIELEAAVRRLGGTLRPAHLAKLEEMARAQEAGFGELEQPITAAPAVRQERPGRNAPCWCGSAKKYKKCHLDADEAARREG